MAGLGRFLFLLDLRTGHELWPWPATRLAAQSSGGRREGTSVSSKTLRFPSRFRPSADWPPAQRQSATPRSTVSSARHFQSHPARECPSERRLKFATKPRRHKAEEAGSVLIRTLFHQRSEGVFSILSYCSSLCLGALLAHLRFLTELKRASRKQRGPRRTASRACL